MSLLTLMLTINKTINLWKSKGRKINKFQSPITKMITDLKTRLLSFKLIQLILTINLMDNKKILKIKLMILIWRKNWIKKRARKKTKKRTNQKRTKNKRKKKVFLFKSQTISKTKIHQKNRFLQRCPKSSD